MRPLPFALLVVIWGLSTSFFVHQAFVIAIPSSFIPKLVYRDRNGGSISGYIDASYAKSTVQINGEFCFYKVCGEYGAGWRSAPYLFLMLSTAELP